MLHILWLILKIIGIVLLGIIGLLLLIMLSMLLVPVRYRGEISYIQEPVGFLKVNWLLHILSIRLQYDKELTVVFRVLGFPAVKRTMFGEEAADKVEETAKAAGDAVKTAAENELEREKPEDARSKERDPDMKAAPKIKEPSDKPETRNRKILSAKNKREGFWARQKKKLFDRIETLRFSFRNFRDKLKRLQEFYHDEENKKSFRLLCRQGKRLLKHVLPRKLKGRIAFGFDDPYTTGQVLVYSSPFFGWYYKHLQLEPYFDRKLFEGEVSFKGQIRVLTIILLVFRVCQDRNIRKHWKAWRQ